VFVVVLVVVVVVVAVVVVVVEEVVVVVVELEHLPRYPLGTEGTQVDFDGSQGEIINGFETVDFVVQAPPMAVNSGAQTPDGNSKMVP